MLFDFRRIAAGVLSQIFIYAFFLWIVIDFFLSDRLTMNAFSTKIKVRIVFFRKDFLFCMHGHAE